ncbi:3'(2'),5'-bisphosphate nucleotidase CysQ [Ancylobacter defluvii]|uniref:3'(2'),5'-bisphosphate nucleotidase CysQ n=1 Tax=Ancylobacter defluvii TaxID=1282440 RepID=A0A9W6K198_9HYPH|nr:3'(2'),5'-bisphosphate nucleotidase CysQ [Ancylobacter defluvii]MBS7588442.1 3'(2'),5'-bisphosphate nucleotidase CysQ [Ancylobacter defluvii]GLK86358.1 3'(2'),5'-bisphosphate nucleotidase CysQ [Ancylobacter defluvii]
MKEAVYSRNEEFLSRLAQLALRAGRVVLDVYATEFAVSNKADNSPVTEADERAETVILAGLRDIAPEIPVIAEEECAAGRMPEIGERFFLVDPLDGTREFLARNGEFTVNIALIENGIPTVGVVHAPALGLLYAGRPGHAFKAKVQDGALVGEAAIAVRSAASCLQVVGSRSHGSPETAEWLKRFSGHSFVSAGSSLKFCLLAEGVADLYPRHGRTMEWDTAAGDAVLRAAGGAVVTLDGTPLRYGKRHQANDSDFANPYFVAFGDPALAAGVARLPDATAS